MDQKDKVNKIFIQKPEIFSIREETFKSEDNRLYILHEPNRGETKNIKVNTLIIRKKDIRVAMRTNLICNKDMLIMDVQEKTKK